jgi:uncharacterized small protein (TIGR04563 family)
MAKRKQSLYLSGEVLAELRREAARLDRSLSWIVQRCVKLGLAELREVDAGPGTPRAPRTKS